MREPVHRCIAVAALLTSASNLATLPLQAAELVRGVRYKISAGDLSSAEAAVEEYRREKGIDPEYLNAVGWLARGAEMLRRPERAAGYVAELRREVRPEAPDLVVPLGAAIEVEGRLLAARDGRGAAVRYLEGELAAAKDVSLRSRIRKNLNLLTLEGEVAPELGGADAAGGKISRLSDLKGRPVLLFFWAEGCGDCQDQGPVIGRIFEKYRDRGLGLIAPTRLYGPGSDGVPATPGEERERIATAWREMQGPRAAGVAVPIDTETMVRYGVSATPTLVLVDRTGRVRLYTPTKLSELELSRRIEELLAEPL